MKPEREDPEFNSPREIVARVALLGCLGALAAGMALMSSGLAAPDLRQFASGFMLLTAAIGVRGGLHRRSTMEGAEQALQEFLQAGPDIDEGRLAEFVRLLREWETLEGRRGGPGFDPWALQAVRHDIRQAVESDPALEELLRPERNRRRAA